MAISATLTERCDGICELCNTLPATEEYAVSPKVGGQPENEVAICATCLAAINDKGQPDYWRCLEGSIWSPWPSVQALSYRLLQFYKSEEWAANVIESVELDDNIVQWAMSAYELADVYKDAFGNTLENGDIVVLTQALNIKGASFSAAKGTIVKKIRLVPDNNEQIEGKISDHTIVILTKFVKKA